MDKKYEHKRKEYDSRRREKLSALRAAAKEAKKDPCSRNLFFLDQILKAMGLSQPQFAKATGMTLQRVYWMFNVADDASLGFIQEIMEQLSVRITPSIVAKENDLTIVQTDGVLVTGILPKVGPRVSRAKYLNECIEKNGRMAFLARFIQESGLNASQFSERIGVEPTSLRFMFEQDNTKVSMLLKIAKAFNCNLKWSVEAIKESN